jgi:hypothetical protein
MAVGLQDMAGLQDSRIAGYTAGLQDMAVGLQDMAAG